MMDSILRYKPNLHGIVKINDQNRGSCVPFKCNSEVYALTCHHVLLSKDQNYNDLDKCDIEVKTELGRYKKSEIITNGSFSQKYDLVLMKLDAEANGEFVELTFSSISMNIKTNNCYFITKHFDDLQHADVQPTKIEQPPNLSEYQYSLTFESKVLIKNDTGSYGHDGFKGISGSGLFYFLTNKPILMGIITKIPKSSIESHTTFVNANLITTFIDNLSTVDINQIEEDLTKKPLTKWLNDKNDAAIADLGVRYTPELNQKLQISEIFEGIGIKQKFQNKLKQHIDNFLIKGNSILKMDIKLQELPEIEKNLTSFRNLYINIDFSNLDNIPIQELLTNINNCQQCIDEIEEKKDLFINEQSEDNKQDSTYEKLAVGWREFREFEHECNNLDTFLNSTVVSLSNNPFLLLEGNAGVGKSHLIADIVTSRMKAGYPALLLLGQKLVTHEAPWIQIFKTLQPDETTSNDFLKQLNLYGEEKRQRFLIFIDAINEGKGNDFWGDNINSFIDEIKQFKWIGLVMSIRSTYKDITITDEQVSRNNFVVYKHLGFENVEIEAANLFFDYYKIERLSSLNLSPGFKNPLYLKTLCDAIIKNNLSKVPTNFYGISEVLNSYIEGINKKLASPREYDYDLSINLVDYAINAIIKSKVDKDINYISVKDAQIAVQSVVSHFIIKRNFLSKLIDEGLLTKEIIYNTDQSREDAIRVSFEKFDDHLTVKHLLRDVQKIEDEFTAEGRFKTYFNNENEFCAKQGIIEALSIQLPEEYGRELYELLPSLMYTPHLIEAYIASLAWRKPSSINLKKMKPFIEESIFTCSMYFDEFLEVIISITGLQDHPLNANFLHDYLLKHTLADRDTFWTTALKFKYNENISSNFKYLIDWAWNKNNKSYISDSSLELVATTLCWFLTSTNRKMRDCSTKALVNILQNRISTLIKIINKFDGVNDPYVSERIYAVALGCTLRTKNHDDLSQLATIVFNKIFNKQSVYPHILLRDYAREIIEYVSYLQLLPKHIDISKTKPPYKSPWPDKIPTKEDLASLYDNDEYMFIWDAVMGFSDFARYTIGTNQNHSDWSSCKIGEEFVDREQALDKFLNKLSEYQNDLYSRTRSINSKSLPLNTTSFELSYDKLYIPKDERTKNMTMFKNSLTKEMCIEFENEIEPYLNDKGFIDRDSQFFDMNLAQCIILNRVIDLGWDPQKHTFFDREIGSGRGRSEKYQERIGKKYQWIAYYEFMAILSDNFYLINGAANKVITYQGTWNPYIRDIDPTILLKKTPIETLNPQNMWWMNEKEVFDWNCTTEEWLSSRSTINNPCGLVQVKDKNNTEWLILESYPLWREPKAIGKKNWDYPGKEIWCQIRGYLVKSSEFENLKSWAKNQNFMGRWMPESTNNHQLFNREYYWSEANQFFQSDYYDGTDWTQVNDRVTNEKISDVNVTAINYLWEQGFDYSKSETLNILKPSSLIFKKMNLSNSENDGSYTDTKGDIVCFATEALHDSKRHLLIKKEPFLTMLKENDLKVLWTLLGEKNFIGGSFNTSNNYQPIEFSGVFYLDNDEIQGAHKIFPS